MSLKRLPFVKYSFFYLIIIAVFSLVGCGVERQKVLLSYSDKKTSTLIETDSIKSDPIHQVKKFAENLCIIPMDYKQKKDHQFHASAVLRLGITDQSVLYAYNPYKKLYPASITKIATALVVFKYGNLNDEVTVSYNAANIIEIGAKKCGLKKGDKINMEVLLTSFLVYSGNDAGIAIAEHIAGSEKAFAILMNEEVQKLGAVNSHFVNSHGLHNDDHYTTAYDIYLILNNLLQYDKFLDIIHTASYKAVYKDESNNIISKVFESTNQYLTGEVETPDDITIIGGKTGTTSKAGSCLVLLTKDKKDHQYISIILNADSGTLFSQMSHLIALYP